MTGDWLLAGPRGRRLLYELVQQSVPVSVDTLDAAVREAVEGEPWTVAETMRAFADAVAWARYWQEPDEVDVALAEAPDLLAPVASQVPVPDWWSAPLAADEQVVVTWEGPSPSFAGAAEALPAWRRETLEDEARARAERPVSLDASWSGRWWSTPSPSGLVATSREASGLALVEDGMGWSAADVQPVAVDPRARVFEVDGPEDWAHLVERFPLEVSASRRHDWWRAVGAREPLLVPDYVAVAQEWDAVHVSARGYLTTATLAVQTSRGTTVLAGWNPDHTWWLTDLVAPVGSARRVTVEPPS